MWEEEQVVSRLHSQCEYCDVALFIAYFVYVDRGDFVFVFIFARHAVGMVSILLPKIAA